MVHDPLRQPATADQDAQPFAGRTAVLIGGATGIGRAVAERYLAGGGSVMIGGRTPARLQAAAQALGAALRWGVVDTTDEVSVRAFFEPIDAVDALFTTAADYVTGPLRELSEEQARTPFESKFWGQYRVVAAAVDRLAPDAAVVLMSGAASVRPAGPAPAYVAANAAVEGLARGLAVELAPVRVTAVAPGTVDGHLWAQRPAQVRDGAFDHARRETVLGRPGTEAEIADAVIHLFRSTYTTGSTLYVDGGYSLR